MDEFMFVVKIPETDSELLDLFFAEFEQRIQRTSIASMNEAKRKLARIRSTQKLEIRTKDQPPIAVVKKG